jgi:peroxiredoxin
MRTRIRVRLALAALIAVAGLTLSGCASGPPSAQSQPGSGTGYISGDGVVAEFAPSKRGKPMKFTGMLLEDGSTVRSRDYAGKVFVVNFWYAACPPCRAEAKDLQKLYTEFVPQGVDFLGVNIRDSNAAAAKAFERSFGITYSSTLDANEGTMQLAFSGKVAPNAVPTTLVIDKQGRVASRILGRITDPSILRALITTALTETTP